MASLMNQINKEIIQHKAVKLSNKLPIMSCDIAVSKVTGFGMIIRLRIRVKELLFFPSSPYPEWL
jgi:hypothetical protein